MRCPDPTLLIFAVASACAPALSETDGEGQDPPGDGSIGLPEPEDTGPFDRDDDGAVAADDCDDDEPSVAPGAPERCNGVDDDCDGEVDEGALRTFFADADGDGAGDPDARTEACDAPDGFVSNDRDCDDDDDAINPAADEVCDGVDQDCDGVADDGATEVFWADADGDGFGDPAAPLEACSAPPDHVDDRSDCDDTDPAVNPDAVEVCDGVDNDCSSSTRESGTVRFVDASGAATDLTAAFSGAVTLADPGTLEVCAGTYTVSLDIQADLTVQRRGAVTLDGGGAALVALADGATLAIDGLTLSGGGSADGAAATLGAGATLAATDTTWTGHTATDGAPFALGAGSALSLDGGAISNNNGTVGIFALGEGAALTCTGATVDQNDGGAAGALSLPDGDAQARSLGCDWTGAGANLPATATTRDAGDHTYGDAAWFTCAATGCTDAVTFAAATGTHREVEGVSPAPAAWTCDRTWALSGVPAAALCDACVFGFDLVATPDPAASTTTSCAGDFSAWTATLAYAPSPTAYAAPMVYAWDDSAWVPWGYGALSGGEVVVTEGVLDDPYTWYGATYYASDYARTALSPE